MQGNVIAKVAKMLAKNSLKANANTTTSVFTYQPKAPADLKKFSRTK